MENDYNNRSDKQKKRPKSGRLTLIVILFAAAVLGVAFSINQFMVVQSTQKDLHTLQEKFLEMEQEYERMKERYDDISDENEILREENKMLRSTRIIDHGSRETGKVAITINDGADGELVNRALDYLKENNVRATFFPLGSWVERSPEVWRRAVEEGHELGNSTYWHHSLTALSEEEVVEELTRWQKAIDEALGEPYRTLFFRPPGGAGYLSGQRDNGGRHQEIIAEKGMFPVLWDVELMYALRHEAYTSARVTEHVLTNARGGSIILLHFIEQDINALPDIISGLRENGLEPCSLSEMLLSGPQT